MVVARDCRDDRPDRRRLAHLRGGDVATIMDAAGRIPPTCPANRTWPLRLRPPSAASRPRPAGVSSMVANHFVVHSVGGLRSYRQVLEYMRHRDLHDRVAVPARRWLFGAMPGPRDRARPDPSRRAQRWIDVGLTILGVLTLAYGHFDRDARVPGLRQVRAWSAWCLSRTAELAEGRPSWRGRWVAGMSRSPPPADWTTKARSAPTRCGSSPRSTPSGPRTVCSW